jgi:hypothetical protein
MGTQTAPNCTILASLNQAIVDSYSLLNKLDSGDLQARSFVFQRIADLHTEQSLHRAACKACRPADVTSIHPAN